MSGTQLQAVPESNQALDGLLVVILGHRTSVEGHRRWSERPGRSQGQFDPWPVPIPAQSPPSRQDPGPRTSVEEHRRWSKRPGRSQGQFDPWPVPIPAQSPPSRQGPGQALGNTDDGQSDQVVAKVNSIHGQFRYLLSHLRTQDPGQALRNTDDGQSDQVVAKVNSIHGQF